MLGNKRASSRRKKDDNNKDKNKKASINQCFNRKKNVKNINKKKNSKTNLIKNIDSNPENLEHIDTLVFYSYCDYSLDNTISVFKSINNILYLIFSNVYKSIISFDLIKNQIINEVKNAHEEDISNFRYFFDKINKIDIILSLSSEDNCIKIWNIQNWECLLELKGKNEYCYLSSACLINDNNENYIITSNLFSIYGSIKVYDFIGNEVKEIKDSKGKKRIIINYYDNTSNKNYIISGFKGYLKSFDFKENKLYKKYKIKCDNGWINSLIVNDKENTIKIIEANENNLLKVWDFHSGELIDVLYLYGGSIGLCLWDNEYLLVGCRDTIQIIDMIKGKRIKYFYEPNSEILCIKKFVHPIYGECFIAKSSDGKIRLYGNKIFKKKFIYEI
jgi:hypothetical protein